MIERAVWEWTLAQVPQTEGTVFFAASSVDYLSYASTTEEQKFPPAMPDDLRPLSSQLLNRVQAIPSVPLASDVSIGNYDEVVMTGSGVHNACGVPSIIVWRGHIRQLSPARAIATSGWYQHGLGLWCEVFELHKIGERWIVVDTLYSIMS
jgi:hypothetical protein